MQGENPRLHVKLLTTDAPTTPSVPANIFEAWALMAAYRLPKTMENAFPTPMASWLRTFSAPIGSSSFSFS
jgi:hypothetical protein